MTKTEAHELLDARKRGLAVLPSAIDQALFITGDLGGNALVFSDGMDSPLQKEDQANWQSKGNNMVAQSGRYYGSEEWFRANHGPKEANE
jgi:Icc-related predicted phosphoesterase